MQESVLKRALGLGTDVADGVRIEGESIIVAAGPRRAAPRCPVRGRRCDGYDALPARRWRAPDAGSARCYVERPEHGFRTADDLIALIMLRCSDLRPALPGRATA